MTTVAVIGAGPNGLTAAARLARAGLDVTVYERADVPGGSARSEDVFGKGTIVDMGAAAHPFGVISPAFNSLGLIDYGLQWCNAQYSLAHPLEGRPAALLHDGLGTTSHELGNDGPAWRAIHGPVTSSPQAAAENFLGPLLRWPAHPLGMARFGMRAVWSAAILARSSFRSEEARALFTGSALHSMLPPAAPLTSAFGVLFGSLGMSTGWPVARGGSQSIVDALVKSLEQAQGRLESGTTVRDLRDLPPHDVAVLDVVPDQLLQLGGTFLPDSYRKSLQSWKCGTAASKVDFLLDGPVPWSDSRVASAGTVHVGGDVHEMALAENQAARGLLPDQPFVVVSQQQSADPIRGGSSGRHVLWSYAHVPNGCNAPMAKRIEAQIERFAPGFKDRIVARHEARPSDLQAWNPNLVGGDIGGGALTGLQQIFRPAPTLHPYRAGRKGLYLCSSATPPGGGVHGMNGWNAAGVVLSDLGFKP